MVPSNPFICFLEIDRLLGGATRHTFRAAAAAFEACAHHNVAAILCSGRTRRELEYITRKLGVWHPFIAEDGSVVCIPRGYFGEAPPASRASGLWEVIDFGSVHRGVEDTIDAVAGRLRLDVVTLGRSARATAMELFDLSRTSAWRARKRTYGEVVRLRRHDDFDLRRLIQGLRNEHLRCTCRGHVVSVVPDLGGVQAVRQLRALFERHCDAPLCVGVDDGQGGGFVGPVVDVTATVECGSLEEVPPWLFHMASDLRQQMRAGAGPASRPDRMASPAHADPHIAQSWHASYSAG